MRVHGAAQFKSEQIFLDGFGFCHGVHEGRDFGRRSGDEGIAQAQDPVPFRSVDEKVFAHFDASHVGADADNAGRRRRRG